MSRQANPQISDQKGHSKIARLVVSIENNHSMERFRAYPQVMAEYGLTEIIQFLHRDWQEPDILSGCKAALQLFTVHPEVTAELVIRESA